MLQVAIDNQSIEEYFKVPEALEKFLEKAVNLDLMSIVDELQNDKLHQKSLNDIQDDNITFYQDSQSLIDDLNA